MMSYRALKKFINANIQPNNIEIFDLIPKDIKSKIVFVVGKYAGNAAAYLSSIMSACGVSHLHYKDIKDLEINRRFSLNGLSVSLDAICDSAENILSKSKRRLSNRDLFLLLSLSFDIVDYICIEVDEDYYNHIKYNISHFALIIADNNDEKASALINSTPNGTAEIISLSKKNNYDYISNKRAKNGARITLASPNKITYANANLLGTEFYHFDYLYHISALDLNNISSAYLAIEAAQVLIGAPRPYIYKGLENAKIPHDLELYSLSPAILLRRGKNDFKLHHRLKFKTVTEDDEFETPTQNTVFCGSEDYIETIKHKLKKR